MWNSYIFISDDIIIICDIIALHRDESYLHSSEGQCVFHDFCSRIRKSRVDEFGFLNNPFDSIVIE
jgi:hypothetical protein